MNINNFEKYINKTILDRGHEYYACNNIIDYYEQDENEYIFRIHGSEVYEVIVKLNNQFDIIYSECDCPYDFGPICKHEAAAFLKLFDIINNKGKKSNVKKEAAKNIGIKEVLNSLSKDELIKIITEVTQKDAALKNSLIVRYSKVNEEEEINNCKNLIDSIVRKHTGRKNYIEYRDTYGFVNDMEEILEKIRETDDVLLALDIAFLLINESIEAYEYADDSGGEIGSLVSETLGAIEEIVVNSIESETDLKGRIFNKLLNQSDNIIFNGWEEYRFDIFRLCSEFADVDELRNKLRAKIEQNINNKLNDKYSTYSIESMLKIILELINSYGTEAEALEFIKENLKYSSFRELLIRKYINENNYQKVIKIALEGEKQDKQYAGLVSKWKNLRYEAYKKLSMKKDQEKLAEELLFDGDFKYYHELKELVTGEKEEFYNNLKQRLKTDKSWRSRDIYIELIEHEKDLDEIMELVRKNPTIVEGYASLLKEKHNEEIIEIYTRYIKSEANISSNRKDYQKVCEMIKRFKKVAGKKKHEAITDEFISLYRKRPAFIDELSRLKKTFAN